MDLLSGLIGLMFGSVLAVIIIIYIFRKKQKELNLHHKEMEDDLQRLHYEKSGLLGEKESILKEKSNLEKQLEDLRKDLLLLNSELAARKQDVLHYQEMLKSKDKEYEEQRSNLKIEFKNLANEILEEKTRKFTEQNSSRLDEILKPFNEKIHGFERKVEDTYQKSLKDQTDLQVELKKLQDLNVKISQEANNLTRALKGDVKKQGNWGEMILEKILERSGLRKGIEYDTQVSLNTEDGKRIQPDVIIICPITNRSLLIPKFPWLHMNYWSIPRTKIQNSSISRNILFPCGNM